MVFIDLHWNEEIKVGFSNTIYRITPYWDLEGNPELKIEKIPEESLAKSEDEQSNFNSQDKEE
jgi:hypothetical protein